MINPDSLKNLNDIRKILSDLPGPDTGAIEKAALREPKLTKPAGALGKLESLNGWLCGWQGRHPARLEKIQTIVFAGNHGVVEEGVSPFPAAVTEQMVLNFKAGGAAINQLCKTVGAKLDVITLDLDKPTQNFTKSAALSEEEFCRAFQAGVEAVNSDMDLICLGEMGIGNTTSAAALCLGLFGGTGADWVGRGTGMEGDGLALKATTVEKGLANNQAAIADGLDVLRCLGGRELVAIAGAIVGARYNQVPVLLDGFVTTAAAATLYKINDKALDHCHVGHASGEKGRRSLLGEIGKEGLLNLGLRLGEASGAVLAVGILQAAVNCHNGMATFAEAGVSDKD